VSRIARRTRSDWAMSTSAKRRPAEKPAVRSVLASRARPLSASMARLSPAANRYGNLLGVGILHESPLNGPAKMRRRAFQAAPFEQEVGEMKRDLRALAAVGSLLVAWSAADAAFAQRRCGRRS
jgi:hypothetical protein